MEEPRDKSESDWLRQAAAEEIENLKLIRATVWDEHTHSYRWLMASLLAINAGACLAIADNAGWGSYRVIAGAAFAVGIFAALLVAVVGQRANQKSLEPLQKIIGYWISVVDDGERDEQLENKLNDELNASIRIGHASRLVGWISAFAFAVGVVTSGLGMNWQQKVEQHDKEDAVGISVK